MNSNSNPILTNRFCVAPRDEDGKVELRPRNFLTKNLLKGRTENVYFAKPTAYICNGDLFKNPPEHQLRGEVKDGYKTIGKQDVVFKPAKMFRDDADYKASYEHMSDRIEVIKSYRDEDGAVQLAPRNITTKPPKKGETGKGCYFSAFPEHLPCDYHNANKIAKAELADHQAKMQERPFSQRIKSQALFNSNKEVIGEDVPLPHKPAVKKEYTGV